MWQLAIVNSFKKYSPLVGSYIKKDFIIGSMSTNSTGYCLASIMIRVLASIVGGNFGNFLGICTSTSRYST